MTTVPALRLDDVGAASKLHEVYGVTRVGLGPWRMPFPGNWLFLKYVPPIKRWAPYRELSAADWESILRVVERRASAMTVAVTAAWVERDGTLVPYPKKFPAAARVLREGVRRGVVEIANHGYTHCVLDSRRYLPRLFSGNRRYHREFYAWVPEATHREHLRRSQDILENFFGMSVVTFVPPGNVFTRLTLEYAASTGLRYLSCLGADRLGPEAGLTPVPEADVVAIHDRDIVVRGIQWFEDLMRDKPVTTVHAVAQRLRTSAG